MKFRFSFLLILSHLVIQAQTDCVQDRYTSDFFTSFSKTTVQYGKNVGINTSDSIDLLMDIYQPLGDMAEARPVIIWAHGGSFFSGNRTDMSGLCEQYVRMGYVTATIDYHLWPILSGFPDTSDVMDVVVKAIGDMKGAIRFFKADQATGNTYKIDSTRIIIGGISAGGILAMHTGHMDETDMIPEFIQDAINNNGGIEGEVNALTNTSDILGIINLSGALYLSAFIDSEDPPFVSYHGTADDVVPYGRGTAINVITMEGSGSCHQQADLVNVPNELISVDGGGHTNIYDPNGAFANDLESFFDNANIFIGNKVCPQLISTVKTFIPTEDIILYPNPSDNEVNVTFPFSQSGLKLTLFDQVGRVIYKSIHQQVTQIRIIKPSEGSGLYFLEISSTNSRLAPVIKKVIFK